MAVRAGDDALYVAEKGGRVRSLRNGLLDPSPVLDIADQVSTGSEQGLLGIAFAPDGGHLYADYTNTAGDTRVVEYAFAGGRVDVASRRELLAVAQPYPNHNGGNLVFGPDGFLYIGLGDGGSAGDPQGNGQRLDTLLAKLLRIDPHPSAGAPYTIPPGNPFAGRAGARPEIWAYGLRNPWRFSFDRETNALWIGDVGQNAVEEIDTVKAGVGGQNYGWNRLEGSRPFAGSAPSGTVAPVHEYTHVDGNCSVTGGYVYRGSRIPGLRGDYLFADYCRGELRALVPSGTAWRAVALGPKLDAISSFGQDAGGELYVLSLSSGVYRLEP
jgi:glucose/arabinose dehydrogenase